MTDLSTSTVCDSVALQFPPDAKIFLAYVDGANTSQNYNEVKKLYPNGLIVPVSTIGTPNVRVYDMEQGDLTPAGAAKVCYVEISNNRRPTVYLSLAKWNDLIAALKSFGIAMAQVDYGIADWTGMPHRVPGSVFTQYANPDTSGGNWDTSLALNSWLGIKPPMPPLPEGVTDMWVKTDAKGNDTVYFTHPITGDLWQYVYEGSNGWVKFNITNLSKAG